jgi:hypothetical protein
VAIAIFGVSAALLLAVVVLVSGARSSPPQRSITVVSAQTSDDSRVVDLTLTACAPRVFATVDDHPDSVQVAVTARGAKRDGGCRQRMVILLEGPLEARPLVDRATGQAVPVEKVPAGQLQPPLTRPLKR